MSETVILIFAAIGVAVSFAVWCWAAARIINARHELGGTARLRALNARVPSAHHTPGVAGHSKTNMRRGSLYPDGTRDPSMRGETP